MNFEVISEEDRSVDDALIDGVRQYNRAALGDEQSRPLSVVVRNDDGEILGGVAGRTIYQQFLITVLWVDEATRGQGIGRLVMEQAESTARQRGCIAAQVDTLSIQAPDFYQKLGFEIVGTVPGMTPDHDRYFLVKNYR